MNSSTEVVVVATIAVKPGSEDTALAALTAAIGKTHAEEGCLAYALHRDLDDPSRFVIVERWASAPALESHAQEPHLKELFATVGPLMSAPPTILRTTAIPAGDTAKGIL
jgi:quinol monooxygenase YgiN